jgi:hypothetical protein
MRPGISFMTMFRRGMRKVSAGALNAIAKEVLRLGNISVGPGLSYISGASGVSFALTADLAASLLLYELIPEATPTETMHPMRWDVTSQEWYSWAKPCVYTEDKFELNTSADYEQVWFLTATRKYTPIIIGQSPSPTGRADSTLRPGYGYSERVWTAEYEDHRVAVVPPVSWPWMLKCTAATSASGFWDASIPINSSSIEPIFPPGAGVPQITEVANPMGDIVESGGIVFAMIDPDPVTYQLLRTQAPSTW